SVLGLLARPLITLNGGTRSVRENSSADESRKYPTPVVHNAPTNGAKVACRSSPCVVIEFLLSDKLAGTNEDGLPVSCSEATSGGETTRVQLLSKGICDVNVSSG